MNRAHLAQLAAPQGRRLGGAALASVAAEALWLPQAAILAWALATAATQPVQGAALLIWAPLGLAALGIMRAGLGVVAANAGEAAADAVIAGERARVLTRADRRAPEADAPPSAALAALIAEKMALLRPWLLRWRPAQARVMTIPLLILAVTLALSWPAALILAISGPVIPLFMALIGLAARDASARQMDEMAGLNALLHERLAALIDIRLLEARDAMLADFASRADALRGRTMAVLRIALLSGAVLELFAALGVAMMAVFVGLSLLGLVDFGGWGHSMRLGEGIFLLLIAPAFFQPLRDLAAAWHDRVAAEAVARDLIADAALPVPAILGTGGPAPGAAPAAITTTGLVLRGRPVPDMEIAPGEALAVTGPSGVGKTSLLMALAGLMPSAGAVRIGGAVLDEATADAWRATLALIPQHPHFREGPLRLSLAPTEPGALADALRLAAAEAIVARLPKGLDTILGEGGAGVSGGEARRLSIAAAALRRPAVILADEPTADLDDATAATVIAGLLALYAQGATLICASHDPRLTGALPRRIALPA